MATSNLPVIHDFSASKTQVMVAEEVILKWKVDDATKVFLDNEIDVNNEDSYKVEIATNRKFTLSAYNKKNYISELLEIKLLEPEILKFEVNDDTITENEPVQICFSIKYVHDWKILAHYSDRSITIDSGTIENGYVVFNHELSVSLNGACKLELVTTNGEVRGIPYIIRMGIRDLSLLMKTSSAVIASGSSLRIDWVAKNVNKLIFNPGNIDVTEMPFYDITPSGEMDISIELKAFGDFGQQLSELRTIFIARINYIDTDNNRNYLKPEFYLKWSSTGLEHLKLLPDNIPVRETEIRHKIQGSVLPVTYTLSGQIFGGSEISTTKTLMPASIQSFNLKKGAVIIGTMATLQWSVTNARFIQLQFSNSPSIVDLTPADCEYYFQVLKSADTVKLIVWGDINVTVSEIPIPRFSGPAIKQFGVQAFKMDLAIHWVPTPTLKMSPKVFQALTVVQKNRNGNSILKNRLWHYVSIPSNLLFNLNIGSNRVHNSRRKTTLKLLLATIARISIISRQLYAKVLNQLKK